MDTNEKKLTRERINVTLRVDKENWEKFKIVMKDLKINASEFFDEMMPRVVEVGIHGGEVAFGIRDQEAYVQSGAMVVGDKPNKKGEDKKK